ncbi:hypothetical protein VI817_001725 [Penicillium citrinum]|nr:hypothetical protein VI817_001725 [Penicillium citrinum]
MTTLTVRGTVFSDETGPFTIPNYRYTFQNNGPLTTTYIPPPRCTDPSRLTLAYRAGFREEEEHLPPRGFYNVDCAMTEYLDCMPTSTTTPMTMAEEQSVPIGVYYSPGIHCPSGWETIAQAARDGDNVPTTSGAMSLNAPESMSFPYHYYTAALMASSLKPSETIAVCCPRYAMSLLLLSILN